MDNRIARALSDQFDRHRIVFWYDDNREFREDFEALSLPGIEKIELANNEFGVKYRVLREAPKQKFLLYHDGPQPAELDNWLLDVQLAHGQFRTDQAALWLAELELGMEFYDLVKTHAPFFEAAARREALKKLLTPNDQVAHIRLKLLAVCASSDPRLESVLANLLQELARDKDDRIRLIERCRLADYLWEQVERTYGYRSDKPGVRDFVISLFKNCYAMGIDADNCALSPDALVFFNGWKDSVRYAEDFTTLSHECADILKIKNDLENRDFRTLLELDYFRQIDLKILDELIPIVVARTASSAEVSSWIRHRRQSRWYNEFEHAYEAIDNASQFTQTLHEATLTMDSLIDGVQRYSSTWFKIDRLYRKFIYHADKSKAASLTEPLRGPIENLYSNNYLLRLNDNFQAFVDRVERWETSRIPLQNEFFNHWVQPLLTRNIRACVIISDAMRFEIGDELLRRIRQEDKFDATLEPAIAMLPSYTQLGMAALLPHKQLEIQDKGTVLVDGLNSAGLQYRAKILAQNAESKRTAAHKADDVMALNSDDARALIRDHDVLYIYHDRIDATGDKRDTESRVFEAVEDTLQDLIALVKKLTSANATNLIITADHGFLYQNLALDESDFVGDDGKSDNILFRNRRFILGKNLPEISSLRTFSATQLGLAGELEVQVPKSINRLRQQGSGSRFVHGGASLQEIVIPVLRVNKSRQSDVRFVDVSIQQGSSKLITSGQLSVTFYQENVVTDKTQPRMLRAGFYTEQGELISNRHDLAFDIESTEMRDREVRVRFIFTSKADDANGQEVLLKLEEQHGDTTHYKEYKSQRYTIRRSFTSDFDF